MGMKRGMLVMGLLAGSLQAQTRRAVGWRDVLPPTFTEPKGFGIDTLLEKQQCLLVLSPALVGPGGLTGMFVTGGLEQAERDAFGEMKEGEPLCSLKLREFFDQVLQLAFPRGVDETRLHLKDCQGSGSVPSLVFALDARAAIVRDGGRRFLELDVSLRLARVAVRDKQVNGVDLLYCDRGKGRASLPKPLKLGPGEKPTREYREELEAALVTAASEAVKGSIGPSLFAYPRVLAATRSWITPSEQPEFGRTLRDLERGDGR